MKNKIFLKTYSQQTVATTFHLQNLTIADKFCLTPRKWGNIKAIGIIFQVHWRHIFSSYLLDHLERPKFWSPPLLTKYNIGVAWGNWWEYLYNMITCWCKCEASNRSLLQTISFSPLHKAPASSSWTPGTRPPRCWPSCWWPPAQTDAPPLSLWPISETNVSNHRKSFRILFKKHAVPSVTICHCICSDLLFSSTPPLSSSLYSPLSQPLEAVSPAREAVVAI